MSLVSLMGQHWSTALPLLLWPEVLAIVVMLRFRSESRHAAAWFTWTTLVLTAQVVGVWLASLEGWVSGDDLSNVVVAAFLASLPGGILGMWFWQFVVDAQDARSGRRAGRVTPGQ